jgi:MFS family permease
MVRHEAAESKFESSMARPLVVLMTIVLCLSSLVLAYVTLNEFNHLLRPELSKKAYKLGQVINDDLHRAFKYGIPFSDLHGANEYLELIIADYDELVYVAISDQKGRLLYQGGAVTETVRNHVGTFSSNQSVPVTSDTAALDATNPLPATELAMSLNYPIPIMVDDNVLGYLHIGIDKHFVQRQLKDIFYDIVVILIVALLVAFQVMLALILFYVTGPIERLHILLDLQANRDFSKFLISRAGDSIGRVARSLSQGAQRLHEHFQALKAQLESMFDEGGMEDHTRISHQLRNLGTRFGIASPEGPAQLLRANAGDIRIPLFMFAFAEELQKSFLPLFVRQVYKPVPWLNESVVIGLPIVMWLAIVGFAAPFSSSLTKRYGSRNIFLMGLLPTIAGFIGCSLAHTVYEIIFWRGTTALGYAMITIACQEYILSDEVGGNRAVNLAIFVGVIMTTCMCGTAIGGIIAARIGYQPVFVIAAILAIAAGFIAYRMLSPKIGSGEEVSEEPQSSMAKIVSVLKNGRFMVFLLCAAIPSAILSAAFLWYLVPLYLFELGATPAEIGRTMMVYYLLIIVAGPLAPRLVDRFGGLVWLVGFGSLLSALGLVFSYNWRSIWAVVLAVVIMGVSHAMTKAPQIALALELCQREIETAGQNVVLSFLRILERLGSIAGLLFSAMMIHIYGYEATIGITGFMVCGAAIFFLVFFMIMRKQTLAVAKG